MNPFKERFRNAKAYFRFQKALKLKRPYFGRYMSAGQLNPARKTVMQRLLKGEMLRRSAALSPEEKQRPFRLLEVGSWAGGSCSAWCDTARDLDLPIIVYCVDPWEYYRDYLSLNDSSHYQAMEKALASDQIFHLFLHNVTVLGHRGRVRVLRGYSGEILSVLRPQSFDFIYIDGNHSYSYFVEDIRNAKALVNPDGVICGDDAEMLFPAVDAEFCRANAEKDFVTCPKNHLEYHPGIALGLHEEFQDQVFLEEGFWAVSRTPDGRFAPSVCRP